MSTVEVEWIYIDNSRRADKSWIKENIVQPILLHSITLGHPITFQFKHQIILPSTQHSSKKLLQYRCRDERGKIWN